MQNGDYYHCFAVVTFYSTPLNYPIGRGTTPAAADTSENTAQSSDQKPVRRGCLAPCAPRPPHRGLVRDGAALRGRGEAEAPKWRRGPRSSPPLASLQRAAGVAPCGPGPPPPPPGGRSGPRLAAAAAIKGRPPPAAASSLAGAAAREWGRARHRPGRVRGGRARLRPGPGPVLWGNVREPSGDGWSAGGWFR